jgi:Uma2 family endonuclease
MATLSQVSLEEYLGTSYEPDMDYVDGKLEERHVGEFEHNLVQRAILFWFYLHEAEWRVLSIQEQRTRVSPTKVRVPDVSVFHQGTPTGSVFSSPQLIAIEILSSEDRRDRMDRKIRNYMDFGVPHIWVVDPVGRVGWDCSTGEWIPTEDFLVSASPIYLSLRELFFKIDQDTIRYR